ncbi:hypothetical protein [Hoeflea sp. AS16]|uniref:hypothetical protein n=1 Tax=Hoeflea sp. AS16 TaxID=3135779 RepID=UPI00317FB757
MPDKRDEIRFSRLGWSAENVPAEVRAAEPDLMMKKWFDYRFISPEDATLLFIRHYQDVFRKKFAEYNDVERAKHVQGIDQNKYLSDDRTRTQVWKARQRADEFGIPYDFYIWSSFEFALRRKRNMFPQPNQLHHPGKAEEYWLEYLATKWGQALEAGVYKVTHPAYRIENYKDLPAQREYRQSVCERGMESGNRLPNYIRQYAIDWKQVPAEEFEKYVTPEVFERAMESVQSDLRHFPPEEPDEATVSTTQLWPSCLGLPGSYASTNPVCAACPMASKCAVVSRFIEGNVSARRPAVDPKLEAKREKAKLRQRRKRERDRAKVNAPTNISIF